MAGDFCFNGRVEGAWLSWEGGRSRVGNVCRCADGRGVYLQERGWEGRTTSVDDTE